MTFHDILPRRLPRPVLTHLTLNLLVALWILAVLNLGFWARLMVVFAGKPAQIGLFGLMVLALTLLILELLGPGRLQKPVAAVLILLAAGASHYERAFGVLVDREVVRSVFETTATESGQLITASAALRIGLTGLLPAVLVFWPEVRRQRGLHQLWRWPLGVVLSLAVMLGALLADYKAFSAVLREHKDLMASSQPGATLVALVRYGREQWKTADPVARPYGEDAEKGPRLLAARKPVLLVLFAGETARAQNFGLDGYARNTTPGLAEREVINFPATSSCGTATAVSLPCMFSSLGQKNYSRDRFLSQENLLDVLARAGFAVHWFDNNTGDQRIAARTGWNRVDAALDPAACAGECTDEAFFPVIDQTLAGITTDTVLVLHMIGSHGPGYYLRYPPERAVYQPDCRTVEFADCTTQEIVNAYDNAMRETDFVLSQTIDRLAASDRALTAMIFLSDHGESLGENGLYLHAAPRFMAPDTQTHVPMVMWMDPAFRKAMGLDVACLRDVARRPSSQDNLFHTVLGLLDVTTAVRDPGLDITATCHRQEAS